MTPLPDYRPQQLSLGPLEKEILSIVWELESVTVKDVHERILSDPQRELAYTSVTTILNRLTKKGWLSCDRQNRVFRWRPLISPQETQIIQAYEQLRNFLAVGNPDVVATFADSLDRATLEQLEAITKKIRSLRQLEEEQ